MSLQLERYFLTNIPQYVKFILHDLPVSLFMSHPSLQTAKSVNFGVVARDGLPCTTEIVYIFDSDYLDHRGAFKLYCCVTS